ncbi:MAG: IPT/TIG domain-containing protein, partial [Candidatus Sulfotelmatobacter sp.]
FTSRIITASGDIAEDSAVSTTGSYSASAPLSTSGNWVMQMATFEAGVSTTNLPTVLSVSPSSGSDNGGTSVTITGTNFVSGAAATFGGTDASNVTFVNSTIITATTRPATAGAVTVLVTNPNGQSGSLNSGYKYTANPTLTFVSPSFGSISGGTFVTITGTNFVSGATVTFGGTAATKVTFVSSTSITATTPVQAAGGVNVVVTNSNGLSGALTNGFVYNATPTTIKFVQVAAATPQTPMSSVSVTYPSAQTAGNLNVVAVGWNDTTSSVQSVTDSRGNMYTLAVGPILGTNLSQSIYYSKNIASGSNTVTATFNQAAAAVDLRVLEYSGADMQNPLDAVASATGNSSTASSGSAPTNAANELVVAADTVYTGNSGAGSGFTRRIITSPDSDLVEDEIVSTASTYGATAPLVSSGPWVMQMVTFTPVQLPATGPLKVSTSNPRYFAEGSGNAVYLTGAHTWPNNKDGWGVPGSCPPPQFNWTGYLNYVQSHRFNWIRLWTWELPTSASEPGAPNTECHLPLPFLRAGPGYATDGQPKFDLTQFNQAFFDRLRQRVIEAGQDGVYVSIMLFDGFGLEFDRVANDGYWFTGANNINEINDGYTTGCCGYNSQTSSIPAISQIQDAYVTKVIDTVNDLPNVLYEIANEAGSYSTMWQEQMIDLIHTYEAAKPYQHPVGFSCQYTGGNDSTYFSSKADYVEPCSSGYGWPVTETSTGNKVVIDDTDHSWTWEDGIQAATRSDPGAMRKWVWENFTRGASTAFMDPYLVVWPVRNCPADSVGEPSTICGTITNNQATTPDPYYDRLRTALSQTATYARQIDLAKMTPQSALCSTTYCLVSPGLQYLVYSPGPGTVTTTGTTTVTWVAGSQFSIGWAAGTEILINGSPFYIAASVTSATSLTVTVAPPKFSTAVPYSVPVTVTLTAGTYNYQWFTANAVAATGTIVASAGSSSFIAPSTPGLTLSTAANASGGTTVYTGMITGGGSNAYAGFQFVVAGFDKSANNGTFTCMASSTTTLTLNNAAGVSDSHAATAAGVGDAVLLLNTN